ncbi:MAG TPA: hypothetical protein VJU82_11145 [Acidobacteriaceae bacterium]|nr:hypothetical protein [Acidobacteriaceae bacterium]
MIALGRNDVFGWFGLTMLVSAWLSVFSTPWFAEIWKPRIFTLAATAVLVSIFLTIAAGRKGSRWWFLLLAISLVSEVILFGDLWAGV